MEIPVLHRGSPKRRATSVRSRGRLLCARATIRKCLHLKDQPEYLCLVARQAMPCAWRRGNKDKCEATCASTTHSLIFLFGWVFTP